ncbi:MAG: hypothetical protein NTAFB01_35960 [Nitrospira sp.]
MGLKGDGLSFVLAHRTHRNNMTGIRWAVLAWAKDASRRDQGLGG